MAQMIICGRVYYLVPLKDPGSVEDFANWIYTTQIIPNQILREIRSQFIVLRAGVLSVPLVPCTSRSMKYDRRHAGLV
jgi:hypothetical protein